MQMQIPKSIQYNSDYMVQLSLQGFADGSNGNDQRVSNDGNGRGEKRAFDVEMRTCPPICLPDIPSWTSDTSA